MNKELVQVTKGEVGVRIFDGATSDCHFIDIAMIEWPSHELLDVPLHRIKQLGEALLEAHAKIAANQP